MNLIKKPEGSVKEKYLQLCNEFCGISIHKPTSLKPPKHFTILILHKDIKVSHMAGYLWANCHFATILYDTESLTTVPSWSKTAGEQVHLHDAALLLKAEASDPLPQVVSGIVERVTV